MNYIALALAALLASGCKGVSPSVVQLPRPNSGEFTFKQAEARRSEIYSLGQSGMKTGWKNPYTGFGVHITRDDEIVVYNGTFAFLGEGKMSVSQFKELLSKYTGMLNGNPLGVLITSEREPSHSPTLSEVVDLLFKPYVQVFYSKST